MGAYFIFYEKLSTELHGKRHRQTRVYSTFFVRIFFNIYFYLFLFYCIIIIFVLFFLYPPPTPHCPQRSYLHPEKNKKKEEGEEEGEKV